jgi:hypothetical protein
MGGVYGTSVCEECMGGVYGRSVWEECMGRVYERSDSPCIRSKSAAARVQQQECSSKSAAAARVQQQECSSKSAAARVQLPHFLLLLLRSHQLSQSFVAVSKRKPCPNGNMRTVNGHSLRTFCLQQLVFEVCVPAEVLRRVPLGLDPIANHDMTALD